jgi:hypothetical protein
MKKVFASCFLACLSLPLWTTPASAWTFGLIVHHGGCCGHRHCCSSFFCVKQYNAFSPVACGSLYLDGCNPFTPPPPYGANGAYGGGDGINFGGTPCDGCSANPAVANPTYAYNYAPQAAPATGYAPAPAYAYAAPPAPPRAPMPVQPYGGAVQANYQAYYAPMTPASVQPNAGRPYYWDANGR